MKRKHLSKELELLDLGMGTVVTHLQQSAIEEKVIISVTITAIYHKTSAGNHQKQSL